MPSRSFRGRIRVDDSGRVTILDGRVRERVYELYAQGVEVEVVIRDPDNSAILQDGGSPGSGNSPDSMCPC